MEEKGESEHPCGNAQSQEGTQNCLHNHTLRACACINANVSVCLMCTQEGDSVAPGDVYCDVETDKATIAWESQEEGFIAKVSYTHLSTQFSIQLLAPLRMQPLLQPPALASLHALAIN